MAAFSVEIRPRYGEVDRMGVVYHAHYLQYFDVGRCERMRALGLPYAQLEEQGCLLAVVDASVRYLLPARYDERLRLEVAVTEARRASVTFGYVLHGEDGSRVATGSTRLGCLDRALRPMRLPASAAELLGRGQREDAARPSWPAALALALALAAPLAEAARAQVATPLESGQAQREELAQLIREREGEWRMRQATLVPVDGWTDAEVELQNRLEHLLPSWQEQQRQGQAGPLERLLTVDVVVGFEAVLRAFHEGPHERRVVAAWALGFARVPDNAAGVASPHARALEALLAALPDANDDVLRNILLALWLQADPATPVAPLADLLAHHHDADVRANTALALGVVVTPRDVEAIREAVLVALRDADPRVRLHAAALARRVPHSAFTERMLALLPAEEFPLVRAALASALGQARARPAAAELVSRLGSPFEVEAQAAHDALVLILGEDRGRDPAAWADLLP